MKKWIDECRKRLRYPVITKACRIPDQRSPEQQGLLRASSTGYKISSHAWRKFARENIPRPPNCCCITTWIILVRGRFGIFIDHFRLGRPKETTFSSTIKAGALREENSVNLVSFYKFFVGPIQINRRNSTLQNTNA